MRDPRIEGLAKVLTQYSVEIQPGQVCEIAATTAAEPLVKAIYEAVLDAGGHPIVNLAVDGQQASFFERASDAQIGWISPGEQWVVENADARIRILSETNTKELSGVAPEKQQILQRARRDLIKRMMERSAEGELRWNVTMFPTDASPGPR